MSATFVLYYIIGILICVPTFSYIFAKAMGDGEITLRRLLWSAFFSTVPVIREAMLLFIFIIHLNIVFNIKKLLDTPIIKVKV